MGVAVAAFYYASGAHAMPRDALSVDPIPVKRGTSQLSKSRSILGAPSWLDTVGRGGGGSMIQDPYISSSEKNDDKEEMPTSSSSHVPPLQFAHGTTTLSFVFQGGAIVAVDSRASMGSFVSSKTTQKVLPINS